MAKGKPLRLHLRLPADEAEADLLLAAIFGAYPAALGRFVQSRQLLRGCAKFEARNKVLAFGAEFLGWPAVGDVDDELFDAAESLAVQLLLYAESCLG